MTGNLTYINGSSVGIVGYSNSIIILNNTNITISKFSFGGNQAFNGIVGLLYSSFTSQNLLVSTIFSVSSSVVEVGMIGLVNTGAIANMTNWSITCTFTGSWGYGGFFGYIN